MSREFFGLPGRILESIPTLSHGKILEIIEHGTIPDRRWTGGVGT